MARWPGGPDVPVAWRGANRNQAGLTRHHFGIRVSVAHEQPAHLLAVAGLRLCEQIAKLGEGTSWAADQAATIVAAAKAQDDNWMPPVAAQEKLAAQGFADDKLTSKGESLMNAGDDGVDEAAEAVAALTPSSGPGAGGTRVTVHGVFLDGFFTAEPTALGAGAAGLVNKKLQRRAQSKTPRSFRSPRWTNSGRRRTCDWKQQSGSVLSHGVLAWPGSDLA